MAARFKFVSIAFILFAGLADAQMMDEYQVKAGFVSSFASFVEWPAEAFTGPREPFAICVLGRNPFGPSLNELVQGKVVEGRAFVVRQIPDVHQADGCHILFISSSEHLRLRSILQSLRNQSIFSVGDTSDFISKGGIVNLRIEGGKIRIDISAEAAKKKHLRISSRLLQLARNVKR